MTTARVLEATDFTLRVTAALRDAIVRFDEVDLDLLAAPLFRAAAPFLAPARAPEDLPAEDLPPDDRAPDRFDDDRLPPDERLDPLFAILAS